MTDLIREAPLGQSLRWLSGNKLFQYPEERADFVVPVQYIAQLESKHNGDQDPSTSSGRARTLCGESDFEALGVPLTRTLTRCRSRAETMPYSNERFEIGQQ